MSRTLRNNGIAIFFGVLLLASLGGQAIAGHAEYNQEQIDHAQITDSKPETISMGRYLTSSSYGQTVMENWQSEYLQFLLFVLATVWLVQRGSPESKEPERAGRESDFDQRVGPHADASSPKWARAGGLRTAIYSNSLVIAMGLFFLGSWFAQSVTGWSAYNADQLQHDSSTVSWVIYLGTASFWEDTLQNWQSEFLAVGTMAILSVYLRQRGSPESKPVGAPHEATGTQG